MSAIVTAAACVVLLAGVILLRSAEAQQRRREIPIKVGIYHPNPDFCSSEPGQRDLRVVRFIMNIHAHPSGRLAPPWYFSVGAVTPDGVVAISLDTNSPWTIPASAGQGKDGSIPGSPEPQVAQPRGLQSWRAALKLVFPDMAPGQENAGIMVNLPLPPRKPFQLSLLNSRGLIPWFDDAEPPQDDAPCIQWPTGVGQQAVRGGYEIRAPALNTRPSVILRGYHTRKDLWRDFRRGRLKALLLEGNDEMSRRDRSGGQPDWRWGRTVGTQQIVIRLSPLLAGRLGPAGRGALSNAIDRGRLASSGGLRGLIPAVRFFSNVMDGALKVESGPLSWNTRDARQQWLSHKNSPNRMSLVVLKHPKLSGLANRLAAQWRRTLNMQLELRVLSVDNFAVAARDRDYDLLLDVVDMEYGSLQEIWRQGLDSNQQSQEIIPLTADRIIAWERDFQRSLPYVPLLVDVHHVLTRGKKAALLLKQLCPGCQPVSR